MTEPTESPAASINILAANRTHRPDPLNRFKMYTGGWNLTNMHYLAETWWAQSAGYTGMPGFVIGLLWVVLGMFMLIVAGCMFVCCPHKLKPVPDFDRFGNYTTLGLLVLFTMVTICGCGAMFTGQEALHTDLSTMFTYMMTQVAAAAKASVSSVPPIAAPQAAQAAAAVGKATNSTSTSIHAALDDIRLWLVILTATVLVLALIGLVFVACRLRPIVYTLVTVGWLLVMGTWILCGVFLLIEAVIGDTCAAMKEWVENPIAGTSFDLIMQCKSNSNTSSSSSSHLSMGELPSIEDDQIQFTEYKFLNGIDQQNHDFYLINYPNPDNHQGYSLWVKKKSIQIKTSTPPLAPAGNDSCSQLRNTFVPIFNTIATNNCPSMRRNAKWVWAAVGVLSWGYMMSICIWIVFTRRSTMRLTKVQASGTTLPFHFEESNKKNDVGSSSAYSTGHSTPTNDISINENGESRRRSNLSKAHH